jgi:hypothetical protein
LVSLDRLRDLEACEERAALQQRHIELLQKQITETDAALKLEVARGEKHAEALMHIARTCDVRTSEVKEQHAAVTAKVEGENAALKAKLVELAASHTAAIDKLEAQHKETVTKLEAGYTALKAQSTSTLSELVAAVTAVTTGAMEILPARPDRRQFAEWRAGGIPPIPVPPPPPPPPPRPPSPPSPPLPPLPVMELPWLPQFNRVWCAAACARGWRAEVDAAAGDARVTVTQEGTKGCCTLRSVAQLSRGLGLSTYRVVVEEYGERGWCGLGFVPSHHGGGRGGRVAEKVAPNLGYHIRNHGGWYIQVFASRAESVPNVQQSGWTAMPPFGVYATTDKVPPVPAGGAVEFAVDYAAGTCLVAFYKPAAVAGGFVQAPHAKMELRFVATRTSDEWGYTRLPIPARTVPTAADSGVALYPAVEVYSGAVCRFAAVL